MEAEAEVEAEGSPGAPQGGGLTVREGRKRQSGRSGGVNLDKMVTSTITVQLVCGEI